MALVDDDRTDLLAYHWHYVNGYARRQEWKRRKFVRNVYLHQQVTGYPMTDHINRDPLDCQTHNLRPATPKSNALNRPPAGVSLLKGRWRARLGDRHLGLFDTEAEAWSARTKALTEAQEAATYAAVEALRRKG